MSPQHSDDTLLIDLWLSVREYIDKKHIEAASSKFIDVIADTLGDDAIKELSNHDDDLDNAIDYYLDDGEEDAEDFDDDVDYL